MTAVGEDLVTQANALVSSVSGSLRQGPGSDLHLLSVVHAVRTSVISRQSLEITLLLADSGLELQANEPLERAQIETLAVLDALQLERRP